MQKNRIKTIIKYCSGEILDIGCLQHKLDNIHSENWLHGELNRKYPGSVIGIDNDRECKKLREYGYEIHEADAENFCLDRKFDTIVAGELIEHLGNPGSFLYCAKSHLKKNGKLVITTPNPFYIDNYMRKIFKIMFINEQHAAWYDEVVLKQLASRYGLGVEEFVFIQEKKPPPHKLRGLLFRIFRRLIPQDLRGETILVVLKNEWEKA